MAGRNSAYSPLPQSNSDSEGSSEELHIAQENRVLKSQNVTSEKAFNEKKSNTINYKLLDTDGGIGATLIRFQPTVDEVSILKPNNKIEIFSTSRKLCFVFSLLLCVLTTVVFVWVLPCSEGVCFSSVAKQGLISWEQSFEGLGKFLCSYFYRCFCSIYYQVPFFFSELFGPISLFPNPLDNMQNLVFFMRKSLNSSKNIHTKSGLISLKGENGIEFWNITLNNEPTDINCNMFDANSDGVNDCLVFGTRFLKAIDSTSGTCFNTLNQFFTFKLL